MSATTISRKRRNHENYYCNKLRKDESSSSFLFPNGSSTTSKTTKTSYVLLRTSMWTVVIVVVVVALQATTTGTTNFVVEAFTSPATTNSRFTQNRQQEPYHQQRNEQQQSNQGMKLHHSFQRDPCSDVQVPSPNWLTNSLSSFGKTLATGVTAVGLCAAVFVGSAFAENELSAIYGNKGIDTSLVDQTCLINQCSVQAKACLQDDPDCRKGLTCTAKCLGDNTCITGCMARYGNNNLDQLLKCTIEDNECIKIAILEGGADTFGTEPDAPMPVVNHFHINSLQGSWYKVMGYNPNYDCYACQRNTFSSVPTTPTPSGIATNPLFVSASAKATSTALPQLRMEVEFSMPHLLPDGSPLPPSSSVRESLQLVSNSAMAGTDGTTDIVESSSMRSIGLNDYSTHETMIFDQGYVTKMDSPDTFVTFNKGSSDEMNFRRTAHSEGEMFGLKFWENWYVIGENDPNADEEFKFIYYNGKTRQNTYNGAFIYSRSKDLSTDSMKKIHQIAVNAGMNPDQFCRIRNGCFIDEPTQNQQQQQQTAPGGNDFFRGIMASTRVSELLGVEPVAARDTIRKYVPTAKVLTPDSTTTTNSEELLLPLGQRNSRPWWYEVGDYLENPHRHFQVMDELRVPVIWPQ